jgi:cytochrome c oxidase subunit 2
VTGRRRLARVVTAGALAVAAGSCSSTYGLPESATEQGREIGDVWGTFMVAAFVVAGIVYALIVWSLLRYRLRRDEPPDAFGRQFHANVPIEVVYTAIPILIVIGLFVVSADVDRFVTGTDGEPDVVLEATAFSWGWRFEYPDLGVVIVSEPSSREEPGPEIAMPLGQTTRVVLRSNDVVHAFWVPAFNFKRDAIPGRATVFDLTPVEEGVYRGVCAEFCGLNHAFMTFQVRTASPEAFDAWVSERAEAAEAVP